MSLYRPWRFDGFRFFPQEVDDRPDERGADPQAREHRLVLVEDLGVEKPHEAIVFDPVANQLGALVRGRDAGFESGDTRDDQPTCRRRLYAVASAASATTLNPGLARFFR